MSRLSNLRFLRLCSRLLAPEGVIRGQICLYSSDTKQVPKIYTKTGDKGTSAVRAGIRRNKDDPVFEAMGTTDELSANIGLAIIFCKESNIPFTDRLRKVQGVIQEINTVLATPKSSEIKIPDFDVDYVTELETWIDQYTEELPALTNFILPSGGKSSAALHIARAVCRRAERRVVPLVLAGEVDGDILQYLNRLSDFLFTSARYAALLDGKEEIIYKPEKFKPAEPAQE